MDRHSDVLILGGGVIGLACALYLRHAGVGVRILEQGMPAGAASHGNCGTLTPSHAPPLSAPGTIGRALGWMLKRDAPLYVNPRPDFERLRWLLGFARRCNPRDFAATAVARAAILQRSRRLIEALVHAQDLECGFAPSGTLIVFRDRRAFERERAHADALRRLQIAVEVLDGPAAEALEPALAPGVAGAFRHPGDACLRPDRYGAELARRVTEQGGVIERGAHIEGFRLAAGRIAAVATSSGEFSGDRVVLALGAWSPLTARALDLRLPMQPGKGYSITWPAQAAAPRMPLVLNERSVCVTAWGDGFRLGSTMEFSGYVEGLNRVRLDALTRGARAYLRHVPQTPPQEEWWGWRPMCVDELPLIGPSTRWSNLLLATGHGMLGVSMSAATGEMVAALCTGNAPQLDPRPYAPARFGL